MFHVEHAPIEKSAALTRSTLDETVAVGSNRLNRQDLSYVGATGRRPVDSPLEPQLTERGTHTPRTPVVVHVSVDRERAFAVVDQASRLPRPK
jgi:hypothetical protein